MRLPILVTAASIFSLTNAIIDGIAVPDTIKAGDGFNAIIRTSNYIQSVYDVAVAFGVAQARDSAELSAKSWDRTISAQVCSFLPSSYT